MKLAGSSTFDADLATVWQVLLSPEAIFRCMPGCERFETVGNEHYQATMRVGVGAIKGAFTGSIRVAEKEPMSRYKLVVEGGGAPGRVRGEGIVTLAARGGATEVAYSGDVEVLGPVASVGQRLLSAASRLFIDQFFKCLERQIALGQTGAPAEAAAQEGGGSGAS